MGDEQKSVWKLLDELLTFAVTDLATANAPIDAAEQRRIAQYIGGKVGELRESYGSVLCSVHRLLDQNDSLAPFDNCIACIRGERDELRGGAIEPFIPQGKQVDSVKDPEVVQPELEPIMLDRSCVTIEDFKPMCRECDENPATKVVMLDARNNGMTVNFGMEMCVECAEEVAGRLRESLPEESEDENA